MIDRKRAKDCVQRWAGQRGFPRERLAAVALVDTLQSVAVSAAHAAAIAEDLMVETVFCPTPHEIRQCAVAIKDQYSRPVATCNDCRGTGWREVKVRGYDAVERCGCRGAS